MKRLLTILSLLLLLRPAAVRAYEIRLGESTNAVVLPADATFAEEALCLAHRVDIQGTAKRDLWLLAAGSVSFDGQSDGDLRVMAASVLLGGEARANLLVYATGLQLTSNSVVRGEAALFGNTVICEGQVEGNAWIFAQSITLGGKWGGNVRIHAQEIRIVPGTTIAGNLVYSAPKPLIYDSSVDIAGTVIQQRNLLPESQPFSLAAFRARAGFLGYLFLAALLAGMPFVGFFPSMAGRAVRQLGTSPWRVLLAGTVTVLLVPFLIAFIFVTLVGIPLALLLGALYLSLTYLSHIVIALWIGHKLLRTSGPQSFSRVLAALAVGLFVLYFTSALPGVAGFIAMPLIILGTGSLVLALLQRPSVTISLPIPPSLPNPTEPVEKSESSENPE